MYSKSNEKDQSGLIDAQLTPLAVVNALNKHIIGQFDAKRSVAIALRSQWRRNVLTDDSLKNNVSSNVWIDSLPFIIATINDT